MTRTDNKNQYYTDAHSGDTSSDDDDKATVHHTELGMSGTSLFRSI